MMNCICIHIVNVIGFVVIV